MRKQESGRLQPPSRDDVIDYAADQARQLSELCFRSGLAEASALLVLAATRLEAKRRAKA